MKSIKSLETNKILIESKRKTRNEHHELHNRLWRQRIKKKSLKSLPYVKKYAFSEVTDFRLYSSIRFPNLNGVFSWEIILSGLKIDFWETARLRSAP